VIYHDFSVCLQNATNKNQYIDVGIHQLTFDELKSSQVFIYLLNK
jgi:hypothetical protein